jgi:hypothetical protein
MGILAVGSSQQPKEAALVLFCVRPWIVLFVDKAKIHEITRTTLKKPLFGAFGCPARNLSVYCAATR